MTGAFAHGAIFFIRDYNPEQNEDNVLARMLDHKEAIISHLSWASLFLGFHTLGLYVHNDVMLAFGTPEKQILIEPIFAQWIQSAHGKTSYGFDVLLSSTSGPAFNAGRSIWLPGWLNAVNENSNSLFLTIGPGDFLVHHAIALGLHTTTLILVKGALDARGSKLMPEYNINKRYILVGTRTTTLFLDTTRSQLVTAFPGICGSCLCMRNMTRVFLSLVAPYLLQRMLERRQQSLHALSHCIWIAWHIDNQC